MVLHIVRDNKVVEVNGTKIPVVLNHMLVECTAVVVPLVTRTSILINFQVDLFHMPLHARALFNASVAQLTHKTVLFLQNLSAHQRIGIY
jgi:hypothetical protein